MIPDTVGNAFGQLGETFWHLGDTLSNPVTDAIGSAVGSGIANAESWFDRTFHSGGSSSASNSGNR